MNARPTIRPSGSRRARFFWLGAMLCLAHSAFAESMRFEPVRLSKAEFSRPHDLVLSADGKLLYVADLGNDVVKVVDPETLAVVGSIGSGELSAPHDVAFDEQGRLYVADTGNDRVAIYEIDGTGGRLTAELRGGIERTEGVAPARGGRTYVTSVGRNGVAYFENSRRIKSAGGHGDGPNRYSRPHDIEVTTDGRVIVADPGNNRLQVLSAELEFQASIGGAPPYDFNEPKYFALDAKDRIYVGDQFNHRVRVFDSRWRLLGQIGTGESGDAPDQLNGLEGVVVRGPDVWIADTYNHRLVRYRRIGVGD